MAQKCLRKDAPDGGKKMRQIWRICTREITFKSFPDSRIWLNTFSDFLQNHFTAHGYLTVSKLFQASLLNMAKTGPICCKKVEQNF